MSFGVSPADILNNLARALVVKQRYASIEEALWELALSSMRSRIVYYRRRIRKLERKYKTDFDTFTISLHGRATPIEEDDWFAWRSARSMLADWQQAYRDLLNDHLR